MKKREQTCLPTGRREWSVYVLRCGDGSLYTGIAKNVDIRLTQHNKGKGAAYTRTHLPVVLVYQETKFTRSKALIREAQLKRLPKNRKELLIATVLVKQDDPSAVAAASIIPVSS